MWLWLSVALARPYNMEVGYHGDFITHPGLEARLTTPLRTGTRGGLRLDGEVGGWWHPERWVTTYLRAGPSLSYLGKKGGHYGLFTHVGAMRGWWSPPVWRVEDGVARRARATGDDFGLVAFGLDFGHDLDAGRVSGWYVRPQLSVRFPTFHGVGWDVALAAGVRL